jgi:hypothetical protein
MFQVDSTTSSNNLRHMPKPTRAARLPIASLPSLGVTISGIDIQFEAFPDLPQNDPMLIRNLGDRLRKLAVNSVKQLAGKVEMVDLAEEAKTANDKVKADIKQADAEGIEMVTNGMRWDPALVFPDSRSLWVVVFADVRNNAPLVDPEGAIPGVTVVGIVVNMESEGKLVPNNSDFVHEVRGVVVKGLPGLNRGEFLRLSKQTKTMTPGAVPYRLQCSNVAPTN